MAAAFIIFFFSRGSIKELSESLNWLMIGGEHGGISIISLIGKVKDVCSAYPVMAVCSVVGIAAALIDRRSKGRQLLYMLIVSTGVIVSLFVSVTEIWGKFNYVMIPFVFLGLQAFILTNKKNWNLFILLFCSGIFYALSLTITSNLGTMAIGQGLSLSCIAAFMLVGDWVKENHIKLTEYYSEGKVKWDKITGQAVVWLVVLTCIAQLGSQLYIRYMRNYWDSLTPQITVTITDGVCRGLKTTEANEARYYYMMNIVEGMEIKPNEKLFIGDIMPWAYLEADREYSGFSAWFNFSGGASMYVEKQSAYWILKPEKLPDCAYLAKDGPMNLDVMSRFLNLEEYWITEDDIAWIIRRK